MGIADIDADLMDDLITEGEASNASYTPPGGGSAISCKVIKDIEGVTDAQGFRKPGTKTIIRFLRSELAAKKGGTFDIGGTTFTVDHVELSDESLGKATVR